MSNPQVTVNEQPQIEIEINSRMPYERMFSILIRDHPDKANELKVLFKKCKRDEIPNNTIDLLLKDILGEELFLSASKKMQQKRSLPVTSSLLTVPYDRIFAILFHDYADQANELQVLFDKCKRDEISRNTFVSLLLDILGDHRQIRRPLVPYDQMFPFLFPEIQQDKANKVQALFDKYKKGEIHKNNFYARMKKIVGEELLSSASEKMRDHQLQESNLLVPVNDKTRTQINSSERVLPFDQLFPFLISHIDPDKASELQTLFVKYKRGQIAEHTFVAFMKGILGDQMLRSETAKVKQQKRNLLVPVNKHPRIDINTSELVLPFEQLFPFLICHIDPDKGVELEVLFDKYKRGEIPQHTFEADMKGILGEQMLRLEIAKMKQQKITNAGSSGTFPQEV